MDHLMITHHQHLMITHHQVRTVRCVACVCACERLRGARVRGWLVLTASRLFEVT